MATARNQSDGNKSKICMESSRFRSAEVEGLSHTPACRRPAAGPAPGLRLGSYPGRSTSSGGVPIIPSHARSRLLVWNPTKQLIVDRSDREVRPAYFRRTLRSLIASLTVTLQVSQEIGRSSLRQTPQNRPGDSTPGASFSSLATYLEAYMLAPLQERSSSTLVPAERWSGLPEQTTSYQNREISRRR